MRNVDDPPRLTMLVRRFHPARLAGVALLLFVLSAGLCKGRVWTATQIPMNVPAQGRINAISVDPVHDEFVAVGSDTGGLYLSRDRGVSFRRVVAALPNDIRDVAWLRPDPSFPGRPANIMLVTTRHDWRLPNGGGLWRSTDRGTTWTQVELDHILRLPAANDLDGYAISQDSSTGLVAVATSHGLALTADRGVSWTVVNPFESGNPNCTAVAYSSGNILVAGQGGLRWSTDSGRTWTAPLTSMTGSNADNYHGLTWGAKSGMAYYVDSATNLSYTINYGQTWRRLAVPPVGSAGGIRFVYEITRGSNLELYFGDTYSVFRLTARADRRSDEIDLTGAWTPLNIPHSDTRCMAFNRLHEPYLLGTDGGLHTTRDRGSNWQANPIRGLEALQIYDVNGQWVGTGSSRRHDIYVGTQDNQLRATSPGWLWPYAYGGEGYFIQMRPSVAAGTPVITFTDLSGVGFTTSGPYFSSARYGLDAATIVDNSDITLNVGVMQPKMIPSGRLIQAIRVGSRVAGPLRSGLAVSNESETSWSQLVQFPEPWGGLPFVSQSFPQIRVFQPYGAGWDSTLHRYRILLLSAMTLAPGFRSTVPVYSRMDGFGSIGITNFMFVWIPIIDVHPSDRATVLAADIAMGVVSQSTNGGNSWTPVTSLMNLVLDGGRYRFATIDDSPFVTAISYCPYDPARILVGCRTGGAYVSNDGGLSWSRVVSSEPMANVTSFHWASASEAYASTYGTGLWQLSAAVEVPIRAHATNDLAPISEGAVDAGQQPRNATVQSDGLSAPPYKGADLLTFLGGSGDPTQPRYDSSDRVRVRLSGLAPQSPKELEVILDHRRLDETEYNLEPKLNELRISCPIGRGGHVLRVVWIRGQTPVETGGLFLVGASEK